MNRFSLRPAVNWRVVVAFAIVGAACLTTRAQTNAWTLSTSGNWEDANWSLGALPGAGQTVMVTNHGWKAVAIGPNTSFNFPGSMTINALVISSPGTDTVNTVLLNYAGFQTPLIAQGVDLSTNTALVVLQSALFVTNSWLTVGGTVIHGAMSQVTTSTLGIAQGGVYDMTNGTLNAIDEFISGRFHQEGGSNYCSVLRDTSDCELLGGDLVVSGGTEFPVAGMYIVGNFNQSGGTVSGTLMIGQSGTGGGAYGLSGGVIQSAYEELPGSSAGPNPDMSYFTQTGGTNFAGDLNVGAAYVQYSEYPWFGVGIFTLTNGLLVTSNLTINGRGSFTQSGGVHTNATMTLTQNWFFHQEQPGGNSYLYNQPGYYSLTDGTLVSGSIDLESGAFSQSGGSCQITTLQMNGGQYSMCWGQLTASNINLSGGANFTETGGSVTQSGTLTLANGNLTAGNGSPQFGLLQLNTGSMLCLSTGACAVHFANSSAMVWSNEPVLVITNWNGSLAGGGLQRIIFGDDDSGLTPQQLAHIEFQNPAGVVPGFYAAVILSTGEVIPDPSATASKVIPPQLSLASQSSGAMRVQLQGAAGWSYLIEVSSNFVDWTPWTNEFNTNGTLTLFDDGATNCPRRFYRAKLQP